MLQYIKVTLRLLNAWPAASLCDGVNEDDGLMDGQPINIIAIHDFYTDPVSLHSSESDQNK